MEIESQYHKYGKLPKPWSYIYILDKEPDYLSMPNKLIQAFRVIRTFLTEKEIEAMKKRENELKNQ